MVRPTTDDDIGLKVLREGLAGAQVIDIVAVHGIGAHPDDSWCKNVGTAESPRLVNWLEEENMLPAVAPSARIMRFGYKSQWFGEGAEWDRISVASMRLLLWLRRRRKEDPFRPLLFIAHCLGGLVVLKALLEAQHDKTDWPGIYISITGLIFFGTPFRGAEGFSQMLEAVRQEYDADKIQPEALKMIEPGNPLLIEILDQFGKTRREAPKKSVACFYEMKPTNVGNIVAKDRMVYLVSESSACLDLSDSTRKFSLLEDHFSMIKFGKPTDEDFLYVREVINEMIRTTFALRPIAIRDGDDLQIPNRSVLPYKHIRSLGAGGQGSIELVEDTNTGRLFAHKLFQRYRGPNLEGFRQEVKNEVAIMRRLSSNSHIIRLFAAYSCNRDFGIILYPVADNGDLKSYLQDISDSGNPATAEEFTILQRAFGCLANGLEFIHSHTIRHKDIKPQNILIHEQRIIYTDFGIALDASQYGNTTTTGIAYAFTRRYCAPEVENSTKRNRKSDIFSLGCVFVDILTVLEPQPNIESLGSEPYFAIINDLRSALNHMRINSPLWSDLVRICLGMLEPDLDRRPSAISLLAEFSALERATSKSTLRYFCDSCALGC